MSSIRNKNGSLLGTAVAAGLTSLCFVTVAVAFHKIGLRQSTRLSGEHDTKRKKSPLSSRTPSELSTTSMDTAPVSNRSGDRRPTVEDEMVDGGALMVRPVGRIESIYRLCVGTPRQGLLAPHARGRILLDGLSGGTSAARDAVDGLEGYSHIWVIFCFHLNTTSRKKSSKIAPPALGGQKVGVFATRSPHRFNPIGISLVKLDGIRSIRRDGKVFLSLDISGLDLVDGTPVLDVKPYVGTYDAPIEGPSSISVPSWVSGGLATKRSVEITESARDTIRHIFHTSPSPAIDFYGSAGGESQEEGFVNIIKCIQEVLAMDVRSSYQTKKAREGKSQAERSERLQNQTPISNGNAKKDCTQQIDNLLVHFEVQQAADLQRSTSEGSGAEDHVVVTSVELLTRQEDM